MREKEHMWILKDLSPKTQVNPDPELVLSLELRNIRQIFGTYWEILCKYWANIKKILGKYWVNKRQILYKNWADIV